ncbi:MAG: leucyl aminopeptidase [Ignavibacteriales bacterium]|nr:leucyl aminopeptidase [Ignavibacteriales bacterium]
MKLTAYKSTLRQVKADAVAVFVYEDKKIFKEQITYLKKFLHNIEQIIELEHFKGKKDEVLSTITQKKINAPRLYITGLGERSSLTLEQYRRSAAAVAKEAQKAKVKHLAFDLQTTEGIINIDNDIRNIAQAIVEGAVLSLYKFDKYITEKKDNRSKISEVTLINADEKRVREIQKTLKETRVICEAVNFARDLANAPSNEIYPESLAERAKQSADRYGYRITIWDKRKIEREGFGGLLAVNAGSATEPRFIILEHNGREKNLDTIVLIGKGITFDSGGISIKPSTGMAEMKMDMSGAAAVIGTMEATTRLKLPIHLVGLIPATENLPSGSAMKPGDIIKHYGGTTSEVDNTDAEGRLILADVIAYASAFRPKAVIDLATLTGACVVALGQHATGMFGNDEELMTKLKAAGEKTFERVWQLPLYEEYEKQIKSDVADVKNVGGKWAGAITAAWFLKKFIPKDQEYKWVHLDIAGTAILEEALPYAPKGGSGVGVRLLIEFLKSWKKNKLLAKVSAEADK